MMTILVLHFSYFPILHFLNDSNYLVFDYFSAITTEDIRPRGGRYDSPRDRGLLGAELPSRSKFTKPNSGTLYDRKESHRMNICNIRLLCYLFIYLIFPI